MLRIANETTLTAGCQWSDWTDEDLLQEYRCTGCREAFDELVCRYERELHCYLYRYLGHAANADDILQKTFLKVLETCDSFDATRKFRPWLYTIAVNEANDHLRRARRFAVISIDAPRGQDNTCTLADMVEGNEPEPFENTMDREIAGKVREAVDALPEPMKRAVYMVYFQGLSYREAAKTLGIHYVTMTARVKRAVGKLNFLLKNVG